jgi:hypothetical protein
MNLEQNIISNEKADKMNETLTDFYIAYLDGQLTAEQFYKQVLDYMTQDAENQNMILNQLVSNGMSQEQANAYLKALLQEVRDGKVSAQEAMAKITDIYCDFCRFSGSCRRLVADLVAASYGDVMV